MNEMRKLMEAIKLIEDFDDEDDPKELIPNTTITDLNGNILTFSVTDYGNGPFISIGEHDEDGFGSGIEISVKTLDRLLGSIKGKL